MITVKMRNAKPSSSGLIIIFVVCLSPLFFTSCQKELIRPDNTAGQAVPVSIQQFQVSASKIVLLQNNESSNALTFSWALSQPSSNTLFSLQVTLNGRSFDEGVEIASGTETTLRITQKDLNAQLLKMTCAGKETSFAFRIRTSQGHSAAASVYTEPIAVNITAYKPYTQYEEAQKIRIPGNFQNWNLATAPAIVSPLKNGEYQGFVYYNNPFPQFLMVKGTEWVASATYSYIGSNKIGFGGTVLSIFGGQGSYLMDVSTNTNTWKYTKISKWGLHGSAVYDVSTGNQDKVLQSSGPDQVWQVTANLIPGDFRIRANDADEISFGQNSKGTPGVPDFKGTDFHISVAGSYTITLDLSAAGNYYYGIRRNG